MIYTRIFMVKNVLATYFASSMSIHTLIEWLNSFIDILNVAFITSEKVYYILSKTIDIFTSMVNKRIGFISNITYN